MKIHHQQLNLRQCGGRLLHGLTVLSLLVPHGSHYHGKCWRTGRPGNSTTRSNIEVSFLVGVGARQAALLAIWSGNRRREIAGCGSSSERND
jgi:hypothetical protein